MADGDTNKDNKIPNQPQQLTGFLTNEEWDELLVNVGKQLQSLEQLPYPNVKEQVFETLETIDAVHREALRRLVRLFKQGVLEQVVTDPAIHTLMEMYDLLPPEKKPSDEPRFKFRHVPVSSNAKVEPDAEAEAESSAPKKPSQPLIPHWVPLMLREEDLESGTIYEVEVDGRHLLVCRAESNTHVIDADCLANQQSMAEGTLSKFNLNCPHHTGCYYDIRDGRRIGQAGQLECYPIKKRDDGRLIVGLNMTYQPDLPAF